MNGKGEKWQLNPTQQDIKQIDSSTYSRKTGSALASELKLVNNENVTAQNELKAANKNSLYFSSSDSVSYAGILTDCLKKIVFDRLIQTRPGYYTRT